MTLLGTDLVCWQPSSPAGHTRRPRNPLLGAGRWEHRRAAAAAARAGSSLPADAASVAADVHSAGKDHSAVSKVTYRHITKGNSTAIGVATPERSEKNSLVMTLSGKEGGERFPFHSDFPLQS